MRPRRSPVRLPPLPGRQRSWQVLWTTAHRWLPALLRLLGVPPRDREDLLQEVLLAAYERLGEYNPWRCVAAVLALRRPPRGPGALSPEEIAARAWLSAIAWRKVSHYLQRAGQRREVPAGLLEHARRWPDEAERPDQRIAAAERLDLVFRLLRALPPERRAILILKDAFELPIRDIAAAMQLNHRTAYTWLRLARLEFQEALRRLRQEEQRALRGGALTPLLGPALEEEEAAPGALQPGTAVEGPASERPERERGRPSKLPRRGLRRLPEIVAAAAAVLIAFEPGDVTVRAASLAQMTARAEAPAAAAGAPAATAAAAPGDAHGEPPSARISTERGSVPVSDARSAAERWRDPLREEQALLAEATAALVRDDRGAALRAIGAHAARFPRGQLAGVRERLRGAALAQPAAGAAAHDDEAGR